MTSQATAPRPISQRLLRLAEASGSLFHRSGTEQLEHWAMLGAALEQVMGFNSVAKLKAASQAGDLDRMLALAATPEGNRTLVALLKDEKQNGHRVALARRAR